MPAELKEVFGEEILGHTIVLLTCGDYLMGLKAEVSKPIPIVHKFHLFHENVSTNICSCLFMHCYELSGGQHEMTHSSTCNNCDGRMSIVLKTPRYKSHMKNQQQSFEFS